MGNHPTIVYDPGVALGCFCFLTARNIGRKSEILIKPFPFQISWSRINATAGYGTSNYLSYLLGNFPDATQMYSFYMSLLLFVII